MTDIEYEKDVMTTALNKVSGYLACERIIIKFIRRYLEKGLADTNIISCLKILNKHFEEVVETTADVNVQMNYRYAIGFINTLLRTPSWRGWVQSIQV